MTEPQITGHISKRFDLELEDIRNKVLSMGGLVENQVANGVKCLVDSDSERARKLIADDHEVNRMEVEIDEECVQILARRQPAAGDLRLIVAVIKTITDLERIGDQAEKLGRIQLELEQQEISSSTYIKLEHLGELVGKILHSALDAFARMNVDDAMATMELDLRVNDEYDSLMREMITHMMEDPRTIRSSLRISWCARALERIGDHAKNICEYVVFLVQGKDVRHIGPKDQPGL
ncbi:MAG TPA: phosphate signaling complex protein PhoU [Gammaproteobacteria bacterium]|nr:phosphate signaling complex protein PhoU [Gammaproteobacteria bacterium]